MEHGVSPDGAARWTVPIDDAFAALHSARSGLTAADAAHRRLTYGPNTAVPHRHTGAFGLLATQFRSPIIVLLFAAAVLSLGLGEVTDGLIILGILIVSGLLGFWQEHRAAGAVEALLERVRTMTTVVRDGVPQQIPLEDVVPGDVVRLAAGACVPGDARLIEANHLFVDQAALTGESFPAEKAPGVVPADAPLAERTNAVFLGTYVVSGSAVALVVDTGRATAFGEVAARLARRPPETEFERGVRRFGYLLLNVALVLVVTTFATNVALRRPVIDALLFTLALAVGLTPQLLPAIVSVTLAHGARRMARAHVIVRRLTSIEELGGMEILCTDKTGTITEGVVAIHTAEDSTGAPSERVRLLAYLNAAFETSYTNPIDDALRAVAPPGAERYTKVAETPYDFVRKRSSVTVACDGARMLITKGALANVLDVCEWVEQPGGTVAPLGAVRASIEARHDALSRDGFRCLAIAYRPLPSDRTRAREAERGLTYVGIVSLSDPIKPDAPAAVEALRRLDVAVKLISGDNRHVAARIAAEAGLGADDVCTGGDLRHATEAALVTIAARVNVFAEVEPNQKERIILALKRAGYAVGYLGDGINDAAALHAADVGISVQTATDVTKQAADVVLLEKDLGVLAQGVRDGRRAFANTLKYVFITTSANFGNMVSMVGASLFAAFLPLLPKQILLLNAITDLPAMAIAADRVDPEMVASPRRWSNRGIRRFMITMGLVSSVFDYLTFGVLLALRVPAATFRTAWFLESVVSEVFVLLVIRTRRAFFRSPVGSALLWASVAVAAATLLLPYSPVAEPLGFTSLPPMLVGLILAIVAAYVAASEGAKHWLGRAEEAWRGREG
jgi:Mg2+-importing ATPase